jgi:hypothetical protein
MTRDVRDVIVDHCMGRVPVSFGRFPARSSEIILKRDQEEGRVPLKPLLEIFRLLRSVRLPKTSNGPVSLGLLNSCRSCRLPSLDHDSGMVLLLRLVIEFE